MVFRLDPCGIVCILFSYSAMAYSDYVIIFHMSTGALNGNIGAIAVIIFYNILVLLMIMSYGCAVFSDPGIVPLPLNPVHVDDRDELQELSKSYPSGWTFCSRCHMFRPPRCYHCRVCHRCIHKMDHHCPWVNNCVGAYNQRFSIQFLVYVGCTSLAALIIVICSWALDPSAVSHGNHHTKIIHSVVLVMISLFFGLFVSAIFVDQMQAILRDETAVELVKKNRRHADLPRLPKIQLLRKVFGKGPIILWLCPCPPFCSRKEDRPTPSQEDADLLTSNDFV
jgi:palmitoyltransferase ZDHHC3/7/25